MTQNRVQWWDFVNTMKNFGFHEVWELLDQWIKELLNEIRHHGITWGQLLSSLHSLIQDPSRTVSPFMHSQNALNKWHVTFNNYAYSSVVPITVITCKYRQQKSNLTLSPQMPVFNQFTFSLTILSSHLHLGPKQPLILRFHTKCCVLFQLASQMIFMGSNRKGSSLLLALDNGSAVNWILSCFKDKRKIIC